MSRSVYITTPIYYVSDVPHLGHAYTTVVADSLARYHRLRGHKTRFLTGTDEHGQKIARLAEARGISPKAYADEYAEAYRRCWTALDISYDEFIRTTDADHVASVQDLWRRIEKTGDIYVGHYEDWYCVACEQFYPETQLEPGGKCPVHKKPVEKVKEESLFFKLSAYRDRLLAHYDAHPDFVQPKMRMNEVRAFVEGELRDLSVSRTTFDWGIPVPDHPKHVVYVWMDALTNYYSATKRASLAGSWDDGVEIIHLVGKEISRFHAVIWPALLMAAGLRLPDKVFAHGWWTVNGDKMSKTAGNVVDPLDLKAELGADAFRYFVLREVPLGLDGDFSHEAMIGRYNAELANDLGNLLNRTLGMVTKYFEGKLPEARAVELRADAEKSRDALFAAMESLAPSEALSEIWALVRRANTYIDQTAPWKADASRRAEILNTLLECARFLSDLLEPFLPERSVEMKRQLGVPTSSQWATWNEAPKFALAQAMPIFPRIDDDRKAALLSKWVVKPVNVTANVTANANAKREEAMPEVEYADFQKFDFRVAVVLEAEPVEKAKKLLKLKVDLGSETRQVVAGIAETYKPEELVGKKVILLANLKPATIRGVESQGMILAAGDEQVVALSGLDRDAPPGTKVR